MPDLERRRIRRGLIASPSGRLERLVSGWACQQNRNASGRRQIFSMLLPGLLIPGETSPHFELAALTDVVLEPVMDATGAEGRRAREAMQNRLFAQLTRLGGFGAYGQIAHLLLELHQRSSQAGLASGCRFGFPVGQERIAEILGLSEVHVNRILSKLRADGMLITGPGWYALPDRDALERCMDDAARAPADEPGRPPRRSAAAITDLAQTETAP